MTDLSPAKARLLARWREAATDESETPGDIPARTSRGPAPLSLAQQRLWILEQLQPGSAAYNLFFCGRLSGRLDPAALTTAVADLVQRHETLRTAVVTISGRPAQRTDALPPPELAVVDLRDSADFDVAVREKMDDEAIHLRFALRTGPPARFLLLRGPDHDCIGLVVHHLVGDGWSLGVALRDLSACYQARVRNEEPPLEALPVTFADFASWQREAVRAEDWQSDLGYWADRLHDLTPLELPLDRPRPAILSLDGDWLPIELGARTSDAIRALARARDTTRQLLPCCSRFTRPCCRGSAAKP
ncbi:condensation domain-containing protein [Fodinicola feengrottensis]|uniref:condensation domain-containing protein n=1 Tax=Fodinicola feengrottensis TaxID=435914 RepID=UPI0013D88304|nr:condensation domain-containing protein [Fodinicola feengrottensis]